jgi:hypothetical protein
VQQEAGHKLNAKQKDSQQDMLGAVSPGRKAAGTARPRLLTQPVILQHTPAPSFRPKGNFSTLPTQTAQKAKPSKHANSLNSPAGLISHPHSV